ncbi:hypothetical protein M422DRAFT_248329 [Sphaerobolus stellatus SS14]|uniref:Uncharacterized protein n=1 Tax=Sphaerobolus stellatus (strain SS14) TaxID=990650 RepID=A0A0C9VVP8_SPHS4|nr:hypothetical protein M422DRAFT_248329 [Sphaerobolus stellatus SS14]
MSSSRKQSEPTVVTMQGVYVSLTLGYKDAPKAELAKIEVDEKDGQAHATVYVDQSSRNYGVHIDISGDLSFLQDQRHCEIHTISPVNRHTMCILQPIKLKLKRERPRSRMCSGRFAFYNTDKGYRFRMTRTVSPLMGSVLVQINQNNDPSKELRFTFDFYRRIKGNVDGPKAKSYLNLAREIVSNKITGNLNTTDIVSGRPTKVRRVVKVAPLPVQSTPINLGSQLARPPDNTTYGSKSRNTTPDSEIVEVRHFKHWVAS